MKNFELVKLIDQGTYGVVYKATDLRNRSLVALKCFKPEMSQPELVNRQMRMLKLLRSPHVVALLESFYQEGRFTAVFEYLPQNLLHAIERFKGKMPISVFRRLALGAAQGIYAVHRTGAVHRDVKPQNFLVGPGMQVKICDFGFARQAKPKDDLTDYVATRWYRSPELLKGERYGQPADVWAFGCLLCEMIDGKPLFPGDTDIDQLSRIEYIFGTQEDSASRIRSFTEINYINYLGTQGCDLLARTLDISQQSRITIGQVLSHPYFTRIDTSLSLKKNCGFIFAATSNTFLSTSLKVRRKQQVQSVVGRSILRPDQAISLLTATAKEAKRKRLVKMGRLFRARIQVSSRDTLIKQNIIRISKIVR